MTKPSRKRIDEPKYLSGWKEISNYLGKGVRTVQRYEQSMGLPVRRPAGKLRAAVVATEAELDAWVAASPIRHEFQLTKPVAVLPKSPSITSAIEEMHRLVEQTRGLQSELRTWVHALGGTIQMLEGETLKKYRDGALPTEIKAETDRIYGLLSPYLNQRTVTRPAS
ncbi:MAG: hypothetical protein WA859_19640 [Candidatus Sulfotelmatobacter sp.]